MKASSERNPVSNNLFPEALHMHRMVSILLPKLKNFQVIEQSSLNNL